MSSQSPSRILIVEDDDKVTIILAELFTKRGYGVSSASSVEEAINLLEQNGYELVIMNMNLPKVNGKELLMEIQKHWPDTAVIAIAKIHDYQSATDAMRRGAEGFITLPFSLDEFEVTIEKALEHRKLRLEVKELQDKTREWGLLDKISHDFKAPIVGIRSNASFLQRRFHQLSDIQINNKLGDILTDCEVLLFQVSQLEYVLGRTPPVSKIENTNIFRDIVVKTINQLKPLIAERGFDASHVHFRVEDVSKLRLYVDKARLNQVVYNLLVNSIKYAEDEPSQFKIQIALDETKDDYIIEFQDWGIGITRGHEQKIFEERFRTTEAISKNVTGTGLGLTIAREFMRDQGGDLILSNNYKPTIFRMTLPKSLKEPPHDSLRG